MPRRHRRVRRVIHPPHEPQAQTLSPTTPQIQLCANVTAVPVALLPLVEDAGWQWRCLHAAASGSAHVSAMTGESAGRLGRQIAGWPLGGGADNAGVCFDREGMDGWRHVMRRQGSLADAWKVNFSPPDIRMRYFRLHWRIYYVWTTSPRCKGFCRRQDIMEGLESKQERRSRSTTSSTTRAEITPYFNKESKLVDTLRHPELSRRGVQTGIQAVHLSPHNLNRSPRSTQSLDLYPSPPCLHMLYNSPHLSSASTMCQARFPVPYWYSSPIQTPAPREKCRDQRNRRPARRGYEGQSECLKVDPSSDLLDLGV